MKHKNVVRSIVMALFLGLASFGFSLQAQAAVTQATAPSTMVTTVNKVVKNRDNNVPVARVRLRGNSADNSIRNFRVRINERIPTVDNGGFSNVKLWVSDDSALQPGADTVIDNVGANVGGATEFSPNYIIGNSIKWFIVSVGISDGVYDGAAFDVTMLANAIDSGGAGGGDGLPVLNPLTAAEARDLTVDLEVYQLTAPQTMAIAGQVISKSSFDTPVIRFKLGADHPDVTLNRVRVQINDRGGNVTPSDFSSVKIWSSANSVFEPGTDTEIPLAAVTINVGSETILNTVPNFQGSNQWFIVTVATSASIAANDTFDVTMLATSYDTGGPGGANNYPITTVLTAAAARDIRCDGSVAVWTNCGPYAAFGNRNCGGGDYTVFSNATAEWPNRTATLSDGPNYSFVGPRFIAGRCGQNVNVGTWFAGIPMRGDATAINKVTAWNCTRTSCVCGGTSEEACWCDNYVAVRNNVSCNPDASVVVPGFGDNLATNIENIPPNILNAGNWVHCDSQNPMTVFDPRSHAAEDNRTRQADFCSWTQRDMAHCPNQSTAPYAVGQEYTYTCSADDHDAPYDTVEYSFQVRKQGAAVWQNCPAAGQWSGDFWCRTSGNQLGFRATDPAGKYEAMCIARDADAGTGALIGANDFAITVIQSQGSSVACDLDDRGDSSYCPGESTTIDANVHPNWANADGQWTFNGSPFTAWGNYPSFNLSFDSGDIGNHNVQMDVRLTADITQTGTCTVPISVLTPSCSCRINSITDDGGNTIGLGQIKTGDNVNISIASPCIDLAGANPFKFEVARDGNCTTAGYTVNPIGSTGCPGPFQGSNTITLDNMDPGVYRVQTEVTQEDGSIRSCAPCNFLVNTAASEWWERRPE